MKPETTSFTASLTLTDRQIDVLQLIAEGLTNQHIGEKIFVSKRTIEGIRADLLTLTGSINTAALIAFAFRNELIK